VELNEAARRIGQHLRLILLFAAMGMALGVLINRAKPDRYTASARLVLDTQDPKSQAESAAIADTVKAFATSPSQVGAALKQAHMRNLRPDEVARNDVAVQNLGASGVVQLSVSAATGLDAAAIANALADAVIRARLDVTRGEADRITGKLDTRIADLSRRIAANDRRIDDLTVQMARTGSPNAANALRAKRDSISRGRDFLAQQRAVLESESVALLSNGAQEPTPTMISQARTPAAADPSGAAADIVLGAILGLILGLGIAGLLETLKPTLVGIDAVAAELDTPVLGALSARSDALLDDAEVERIAARLRLAAKTAKVRHVGLVSARPDIDAIGLARRLESTLAAPEPRPQGEASDPDAWPSDHGVLSGPADTAGSAPPAPAPFRVRVVDHHAPPAVNGTPYGLVFVTPPTLKKQDLVGPRHLLRISAAPLLGVVAYPFR
jgi:uncharacterized protein involved in exopolysaccharide biosynthesis